MNHDLSIHSKDRTTRFNIADDLSVRVTQNVRDAAGEWFHRELTLNQPEIKALVEAWRELTKC